MGMGAHHHPLPDGIVRQGQALVAERVRQPQRVGGQGLRRQVGPLPGDGTGVQTGMDAESWYDWLPLAEPAS